MKKYNFLMSPFLLLFLLCLGEILMTSYCRNIAGDIASPLILFLISISISIIPIYLFKSQKLSENIFSDKIKDKHLYAAIGIFFITVIIFLFIPRGGIINLYRCFLIDSKLSDVIPTIQVMCYRLLHHESIYVSIEQFGYHLPTTYMPFMWLPYTISEKFHFDYRWITLIIFIIGVLVVLIGTVRMNNNGLIFSLIYGFLLLELVEKNSDVMGWTVEIMNGTYYSILLLSFFSKNKYLKAIALAICILSRYSLILFIPIYFIVEWKENGFKKTAQFGILTLAILIIFLAPLVKNNWMELYNGYKYYSISGLNEWLHVDEKDIPVHIANGNGFVSWVYFFKNGSVAERFAFAKSLHLSMVICVTLLISIFYFILKNKIDYRIFLLCSLKIYLAVFYGFIQVPYTYLFVVPIMYSIALLLLVSKIYYNNRNEIKKI